MRNVWIAKYMYQRQNEIVTHTPGGRTWALYSRSHHGKGRDRLGLFAVAVVTKKAWPAGDDCAKSRAITAKKKKNEKPQSAWF